ncbi:hypothetical protein HETIRDRAFT_325274 [Heterobasidion irregulare TC 32-1]|uniref:C2H2-type domain-containing protein n=1 Tax=Heterobasidion irregulare (strain TC 32-1) TaxID=747525 RepID=W4JWE0_HETIT|nr:uncharacterized protein HETIRDRAFT_325274 [Heterobasidion irregulare TC 32-1]ETW77769.1 hypothetical protein HETIRDRAFT_325274 [Heterobasidion irregulare TC 32-1]
MYTASYIQSDLYSLNPLGREPADIPDYPLGGITSNVIPEGIAFMNYGNDTYHSPYVPADTNSDELMEFFPSIQPEPTILDNFPDETGLLEAFQSHHMIPQIADFSSTGYDFSLTHRQDQPSDVRSFDWLIDQDQFEIDNIGYSVASFTAKPAPSGIVGIRPHLEGSAFSESSLSYDSGLDHPSSCTPDEFTESNSGTQPEAQSCVSNIVTSPEERAFPEETKSPAHNICGVCLRRCSTPWNSKEHVETHNPERVKQHVCTIEGCEYASRRKNDVERHMKSRKHTA